jgi:Zn-dependent protease
LSISPDAIVWLVVFVISVTAHEAAHALAAYWGGDSTAYRAGQVSLNPVPHMRREPFGMVMMPLISVVSMGWPIGWASTPYDPAWEQRYPRRAAWMAAAGPAANFAIAALALIGLHLGLASGVFSPPESANFSQLVDAGTPLMGSLGRFLSMLLVLNAILGLFNLLPVPPLDGAAILGLFLPDDLSLRLKQVMMSPGVGMIGLLAAWYFFGELVGPLFGGLLALVHPTLSYG